MLATLLLMFNSDSGYRYKFISLAIKVNPEAKVLVNWYNTTLYNLI